MRLTCWIQQVKVITYNDLVSPVTIKVVHRRRRLSPFQPSCSASSSAQGDAITRRRLVVDAVLSSDVHAAENLTIVGRARTGVASSRRVIPLNRTSKFDRSNLDLGCDGETGLAPSAVV